MSVVRIGNVTGSCSIGSVTINGRRIDLGEGATRKGRTLRVMLDEEEKGRMIIQAGDAIDVQVTAERVGRIESSCGNITINGDVEGDVHTSCGNVNLTGSCRKASTSCGNVYNKF